MHKPIVRVDREGRLVMMTWRHTVFLVLTTVLYGVLIFYAVPSMIQ